MRRSRLVFGFSVLTGIIGCSAIYSLANGVEIELRKSENAPLCSALRNVVERQGFKIGAPNDIQGLTEKDVNKLRFVPWTPTKRSEIYPSLSTDEARQFSQAISRAESSPRQTVEFERLDKSFKLRGLNIALYRYKNYQWRQWDCFLSSPKHPSLSNAFNMTIYGDRKPLYGSRCSVLIYDNELYILSNGEGIWFAVFKPEIVAKSDLYMRTVCLIRDQKPHEPYK